MRDGPWGALCISVYSLKKRAQPIDRRGHSAAHGTDGRYTLTIKGGQHRGDDSNLCHVRMRGKGVATAAVQISLSSLRCHCKGGE